MCSPHTATTALIAAALLAACTGASSAGAPSQPTDEPVGQVAPTAISSNTDQPSSSDVDVAPLGWFANNYSHNSWVIGVAQDKLTGECMRKAGFDFQAPSPEPAAGRNERARYGLLSEQDAAAYGYGGRPEDEIVITTGSEFVPQDDAGMKAFTAALDGAPGSERVVPIINPETGASTASQTVGTGCWDQANATIFGSDEAFVQYITDDLWLQDVIGQSLTSALADPAVVEAEADWSRCMQRSGYSFATPDEPRSQDWGERRPSATEIETATTDARCRAESSYEETLVAADSRAQNDLVSRFPDLIDDATQRWQGYLELAARATGG
jgi:hypothetical protein